MSDTEDPGLPPDLRLLKGLVTVLTAVMIGGVIAIVALLVIRLPGGARAPASPEALVLPEGAEVHAVTEAPGRWLVTTRDGRLLVFGADGTFERDIPLR